MCEHRDREIGRNAKNKLCQCMSNVIFYSSILLVHPTPNNQLGVGLSSLRSGESQSLRSKSLGKLIKTSHLSESLKKDSCSELTLN